MSFQPSRMALMPVRRHPARSKGNIKAGLCERCCPKWLGVNVLHDQLYACATQLFIYNYVDIDLDYSGLKQITRISTCNYLFLMITKIRGWCYLINVMYVMVYQSLEKLYMNVKIYIHECQHITNSLLLAAAMCVPSELTNLYNLVENGNHCEDYSLLLPFYVNRTKKHTCVLRKAHNEL